MRYKLSINNQGKIIQTAHRKEKAKLKTIFTDLDTDKPKMIYPDNMELIKINKFGDTYWLLGPPGRYATALFIVNTKENWHVQQKAISFPTGQSLFY